MGQGKELFQNSVTGVAGGLAGAIGSQLGYGLGELTGYNDRLKKDQLEQQQALTNMQYAANSALMKESFEQQLNIWNHTNYEAQIEHIKNAGLNPAMLYAKGGAGGTTGSGGASVGGGQASDQASRQQAQTAQALAGMGLMKLKAETNLLNAQANNLNQQGEGQWIENVRKKYMDMMGTSAKSEEGIGYINPYIKKGESGHMHWINQNSFTIEDIGAKITATVAQKDKAIAEQLLTNNKAMGYLQELANATKNADSQAAQAAAIKLAAEFNYGEYTNWKYWVQIGKGITNIGIKP